ncbi:response regulator [Flavitalea sp.]|nr:response regulator [Flavitalea sp.]
MKTIAILEPHEILRLCLGEVLTHLNYQVVIKSGNALDFIELLATADQLPHIIISEVQLNELQDISLFRHLRLHYPEIKLLAYSGDDSEWTVDLVLKEGADAFLEKGCSLQELQLVLHQITCMEFQPR